MPKRGQKTKDSSTALKNVLTIIGIISGALSLLFFLFIILSVVFAFTSPAAFEKGNVAVIPIKGIILSEKDKGAFAAQSVSSTQVKDWLKKANEDKMVQAIVLEINSPGGTPVATEEIARAIRESEKPTYAVIQDIGASGAYWAASAADTIFASRMSIVGSIGVVASYVELAGTLERYNATYRSLTAGEFKDAGSPLKKLTPREEAMFQKQLDQIHDIFIKEVAKNRGLPEDKVREIANGWVYLGDEALTFGLIDRIGNIDDAFAYIEETQEITVTPAHYSPVPTIFGSLFGVFNDASFNIGRGIGREIKEPSAEKQLQVWT